MCRPCLLAGLLLWLGVGALRAAEAPIERYATVEIDRAKTSIYVGSVTMTMPPFARKDGVFHSTYTAKVFPYFFYNDKGKIEIEVSDEDLRKLERGETIQFTGRGLSDKGETYHVEGRAVPANSTSGKIKVKVQVSKKIELIFNTTYRFPEPKDR
jgi:hypothetical protein